MSTVLKELLPSSIPRSTLPTSELVLNTINDLKIIFPSYEFKSKLAFNVEVEVKRAIKKNEGNTEVFIADRMSRGGAKISVSKTEDNWEEKFREKVTEYANR
jgi:hypothetical protein